MQIIAFASRLFAERVYEVLKIFEDNASGSTEIDSMIEIQTSLGKIGVFPEQNDTIYSEYMLLINLGGDDAYLSNTACAFGPDYPISLVIDLDGKDTYGSEMEDKNIACSLFGISMLIDRRGNDTYYSTKYGEAFSFGGMSILDDSEGDDKYISKSGYSQASAFFGYSMLTDRGGSDTYISGSYSQGFGGTNGIGLLLDQGGDDKYISQGSSFCQGAAKGRWADAGDGFNMGGGHGLLIDIKGNDTYLQNLLAREPHITMDWGFLMIAAEMISTMPFLIARAQPLTILLAACSRMMVMINIIWIHHLKTSRK